jgi:hypothetical protein
MYEQDLDTLVWNSLKMAGSSTTLMLTRYILSPPRLTTASPSKIILPTGVSSTTSSITPFAIRVGLIMLIRNRRQVFMGTTTWPSILVVALHAHNPAPSCGDICQGHRADCFTGNSGRPHVIRVIEYASKRESGCIKSQLSRFNPGEGVCISLQLGKLELPACCLVSSRCLFASIEP